VDSRETAKRRSPWSWLRSKIGRRAAPDDDEYLYRLLLGRAAGRGELAAHSGRDVVSVVSDLARSRAHREIMRATLEEDVAWLYREMLRREPEGADVVARRVGRPLLEVVLEFTRSDEYRARARAATAADVETLYQRVLHRPPEDAAAVTTRVGLPLLDVAKDVYQSAEARAMQGIEVDELQEWCTLFLGAPVDEAWACELVEVLRSLRIRRVALLEHLLRMHLRRRGVEGPGETVIGRSSGESLSSRADYSPTRHFGSKITLVVPTIDSAAWIQSVVEFYDEIGIRPLYVVDSRTRDATREILAEAKQDWIKVAAAAPRVEAMLPGILGRVHTAWVLRLDDDELPSPELLRCCDEAVDRCEAPVWGFPRLCLRWEPGRPTLDYSTFLTFGPAADMDRQWRLFRPDRVRLRDDVHTPGFDSTVRTRAPADAFILHFDWILRSPARRREKAESYKAQAESGALRQVLYETVPDEWHQFVPLDHPRSLDFARRIHQAVR
jgi:hypothetical protein